MMKTVEGLERILFIIFFVTHVPVTLLIDIQVISGDHRNPQILLEDLVRWCSRRLTGDSLMGDNNIEMMTIDHVIPEGGGNEYTARNSKVWFLWAIIFTELVFQASFFVVMILHYIIMCRKKNYNRNIMNKGHSDHDRDIISTTTTDENHELTLPSWYVNGDDDFSSYHPKWCHCRLLRFISAVATIMPIVFTFITSNELSTNQKIACGSMYAPYFLIMPLLWMASSSSRDE